MFINFNDIYIFEQAKIYQTKSFTWSQDNKMYLEYCKNPSAIYFFLSSFYFIFLYMFFMNIE